MHLPSWLRAVASPKVQIWMNGILLLVFVAQVPPAVLWWSESIAYLVYLSVYAVIAAHWSALVGALSWLSSKRVEDSNGDA